MLWILGGIFILWAITCAGRRILAFFLNPLATDQSLVLSWGLGFGILSYSVLLMGLWGSFTYPAIILFLFMLALVGLFKVQNHPLRLREMKGDLMPPVTLLGLGIGLVSLTILILSLSGVLAPDISNDSLCYHLHLPKLYVQDSRIGFYPLEFNSTFPFFMEMLYALGLGLGSLTLAQFFHWSTGLLAALSIVAFARIRASLSTAWMAAILFVTTPGILNEMPTTYVDVAQACFTGLSFFCLLEWITTRQKRWLVVSGIFSGFMMSIKYLAAISILAQLILILFFTFREKRGWKKGLARLITYGLPILICGGYWYAQAWIHRGNPFFPYFYSIFKAGDPGIHYDDIGVRKNLVEFLKIFWTMTLHPEKFEGYGVQIGPAFLMFLPLAFKGLRKTPWLQAAWFYAGFYLLCWFLLGQSLRFLFPLLPVLALLIAYGIHSFSLSPGLKTGLRILVIGVLGVHLALAAFHFRREFKVALGLESREAYLMRRERSYGMASYINQHLPPKAKIMNLGETHLFYFDRPIIRESVFDFFENYTKNTSNSNFVFQSLKEKGFTHILFPVNRFTQESIKSLNPLRLPRILTEHQNELAGVLKLLYTTAFTDPDTHEKTEYFLYQIL